MKPSKMIYEYWLNGCRNSIKEAFRTLALYEIIPLCYYDCFAKVTKGWYWWDSSDRSGVYDPEVNAWVTVIERDRGGIDILFEEVETDA